MEAGKIRKFLPYTPEILLLMSALVCFMGEWLATSNINGIMVSGILLIVALLIWRNKYFALSIAVLLAVASIFFLLALLSEFHEFPVENPGRWQMLLAGTAIFGSLLALSLIMPRKYFIK